MSREESDTCPPGTPGQTLVTPRMYQDQDSGVAIAWELAKPAIS